MKLMEHQSGSLDILFSISTQHAVAPSRGAVVYCVMWAGYTVQYIFHGT